MRKATQNFPMNANSKRLQDITEEQARRADKLRLKPYQMVIIKLLTEDTDPVQTYTVGQTINCYPKVELVAEKEKEKEDGV
jgi:hypothetical protein